MQEASKYYKRSGAISFVGLILMAALALPLAAVTGAIYGIGIYYVPFVKISFLVTFAAAAGFGFALAGLGILGKMRSMGILLVVSVVSGTLLWYVSWIAWVFAMTDHEVIFIDPRGLVEIMTIGFHEGFWGMGSSGGPVTGYPLVGIWFLEAALIIGLAAIIPVSVLGDKLFCEPCNAWIGGSSEFPQREAMENPDSVKAALEADDFESLAALGPRMGSDKPYTSVAVKCCEKCGGLGYLQVKACTLVQSKNGIETKETDVVKHLIVPPAVTDFLNRRWAAGGAPPPQAPATE